MNPAQPETMTTAAAPARSRAAHAPPMARSPPGRRFRARTELSFEANSRTRDSTAGGIVAFRSTSRDAFTPANDAVKCTTVSTG
jgi:hypothetical protein